MRPGARRRALAWAGRVLALLLVVAAASNRLPHLVLTLAAITSLLTMVAAPLALLDRRAEGGWWRWSIPAFPAIALMSAGTIAYQAPPAVATLGQGGPVTALALSALFVMALGFWSVVMPPARLRGLHAAGYVIGGSLPISMPAMFLIMLPRDIYTAFHAAAAGPLTPTDDQTFAGFLMFACVKITLFVAFSVIFLSAISERVEGEEGDGGQGGRRVPPGLPGWVVEVVRGQQTVDEPVPAPRQSVETPPEPVGAGSTRG